MDEIELHRAGSSEVSIVSEITNAAYCKYIPLIGREPQPMTANYDRMIGEGAEVWLLSLSKQPAGVLVLVEEPDCLLIYSVAIKPEYQNRGLGRRLLRLAEERAAANGHRLIRLYTNEKFEENIRLYEQLGYQITGREPMMNSIVVHLAKQR